MLSCTDLIHQLDGIINNILKTGEVTPAIQAPLAQLIERIKAFGITGAIKGRDIPEFYYYHATRVLRLLFIKAQRRFSQARERLENPRVAKDFQALLPNIAELCTAIEILAPQKDNREENAMIIENSTDHLYEEALDRDFMFTPGRGDEDRRDLCGNLEGCYFSREINSTKKGEDSCFIQLTLTYLRERRAIARSRD